MHTLYHYPICPLSGQVRIYLKEFNQDFSIIKEDYWTRRDEFIKINPAGNLPFLQLESHTLTGIYSITEYLSETLEDFYWKCN